MTPCLARADTNEECGWCWNKAELKHETFSQVEVDIYVCYGFKYYMVLG